MPVHKHSKAPPRLALAAISNFLQRRAPSMQEKPQTSDEEKENRRIDFRRDPPPHLDERHKYLDFDSSVRITAWREGVRTPVEEDFEITQEIPLSVALTSPPTPTVLYSLKQIHANAYLPPLLFRHNDIVGRHCLSENTTSDSFFYDISAVEVPALIEHRGLFVASNDPILKDPACFRNHAMRIFIQYPVMPSPSDGPRFEFVGEYYILKTCDVLSAREWRKGVPEAQKQILADRYHRSRRSFSNSRVPDRSHPAKDIRKMLDRGEIYPRIMVTRATRPIVMVAESFIDMDVDIDGNTFDPIEYEREDTASEYSNMSEPECIDNAQRQKFKYPDIRAFRFP